MRGEERGDGDHAVAARAVFDHDRLAPALRQFVGESRAPISTPLPGPSVTMKRTGRFGQDSAAAGATASAQSKDAAISADSAQSGFRAICHRFLHPPGGRSWRRPLRTFK